MSSFAADVAAGLGVGTSAEEVDAVLALAKVIPSGAMPVPRRLRLQRLTFTGVKPPRSARHTEVEGGFPQVISSTGSIDLDPDTERGDEVEADVDELIDTDVGGEPFTFVWDLGPGLYALGSYENFRGKSTVLETILWALRGRCGLQRDVRAWFRYVQLEFAVESEQLTASFDVAGGMPSGHVMSGGGDRSVVLASFNDHDSFEAAMDEVMMPRLELTVIPAWQNTPGGGDGQAVKHAWVTYAGALFVAHNSLDNLLGDTSFSGLPGRLLQMFVGTPWASTMVEAQVATKAARAELEAVRRRARSDAEARATDHNSVADALREARDRLEALPDVSREMSELSGVVEDVVARSVAMTDLQRAVAQAARGRDEVAASLGEEEARRHALVEDVLARRFFNTFAPTACPRCASPVTAERYSSEGRDHACSVCASELDLDAFAEELVLAADVPSEERDSARAGASLARQGARDGSDTEATQHDDDDASEQVDDLVALAEALTEAQARLDELTARLGEEQTALDAAAATVAATRSGEDILSARHSAELDVARLEGALEQLLRVAGRTEDSAEQVLARRAEILATAEKVAKGRVQAAQQDLLTNVSAHILELGRQFGIEALEQVKLRGNATLEVHKGGQKTSYGRCTRGEQLRLKVATAVALLRVGFESGVGRHPGLLLVDSPGAEEATPENLDAMLAALAQVAADVPHLQVVVGTRSPQTLEALLDDDHRRVAPKGGYVW
jgi:hypothetical protein